MKDSKFKLFLKRELQREAQEELEKVQSDERIRNLKMPDELREQIWENIQRRMDESE